jgi:hypothetical protein
MSSSEEGSEIKLKPIFRNPSSPSPSHSDEPDADRLAPSSRPQETVSRMHVEYYHQGSSFKKPTTSLPTSYRKKQAFNKRADQLGFLFLIFTIILVGAIFLGLALHNRWDAHSPAVLTSKSGDKNLQKGLPFELSLNEGKQIFEKVFAEEKELKNRGGTSTSLRGNSIFQDLGISAQEQLKSMNQKTKEIRSLMSETGSDTNPPQTTIKGRVKPQPVNPDNFNSPVDFNSMLSKPLQQTNLP